ncbi:hypothetical protein F895_02638 [Acinetobacter sp. CIP 64.2]|uniref:hypothetical protein n=1 Tax=Acinetobacter sp. CIP 64.2 TaxID=1217694 RepID=UPI000288F548|nr:hypothetical protein [Acinetobacter sp. CIP 64.2]ENX13334.1 hypothetical protein F895_02638 [Acinetobacter sp. CIP 64.2]
MKQIAFNNNPSFQFGKVMLTSWAIATGFVGGGALIGTKLTHSQPQPEAPTYSFGNTHSDYGVLAVQITSESTGNAVVNLDGFRVYSGFDFEVVADDNGMLGSKDEAVFINNFAVERILTPDGKEYNVFTNKDDIRNMITVITAHIEKNKMVEGV